MEIRVSQTKISNKQAVISGFALCACARICGDTVLLLTCSAYVSDDVIAVL